MLVTSIECDTLNKKNIDLQEELRKIDDKLKSMSVKYNSLEVSLNKHFEGSCELLRKQFDIMSNSGIILFFTNNKR